MTTTSLKSGAADFRGHSKAVDPDVEFSLVTGDCAFRLQRALHLIPARGLGVGRRALLGVCITWVPLVVAAAVAERLWQGTADDSLARHFGIHIRFLLAIPVLILGEARLHSVVRELIPYFVRSGLVVDADRARFVAIVRRATAWRDGWQPWLVIGVVVVSAVATDPFTQDGHELLWAADERHWATLGFAKAWFHFVSRPIFVALVLAWVWRLVLVTTLMARISRLRLALVATHPDRAGGLGFLQNLPGAFAPLSFALAAVLAARWGHQAIYHGVPLASFQMPGVVFAIIVAGALFVPLAMFMPRLLALRRRALLDYGALVTEHDQLVERRWLLGETLPDDALLSAPELGPVADTVSLYDAVARTRPVPAGKRTLIQIALPIALPMLPLIAIEVPIKDALLKVLGTLL
jgi:hypothetical protein